MAAFGEFQPLLKCRAKGTIWPIADIGRTDKRAHG
jgi:hypothetical protein